MRMPTIPINPELLRRYDRPGPRYTSYPTAPQFRNDFGEKAFRAAARATNDDPIPRRLSLYVHLPFCASPCFYCGCNRVITRDTARAGDYLEHLATEISLCAPLFDRDREVVQLHLGGGTPNFFTPKQLGSLLESLRANFSFTSAANLECSIELDPRFITPAEVHALAAIGFNRASLGVQDFDPKVQAAINRLQSVEQTRAIVEACRASGMRSVNVDLIYGLPRQQLASFSTTLATVIDMRPDRVAIYGYAHLPTLFRPQKQIVENELPCAQMRLELLQLAISALAAAGYVHIGMDHFALPQDELAQAREHGSLQRNFMGYTTHANTDLIGLGVSAISQIGDCYSQNARDLTGWGAALENTRLPVFRGMLMSADDQLRADVIQQLMCQGEVPLAALERRHGIDFREYFTDALERLQPLIADGLVMIRHDRIKVSERGRLLLRNIAMCFDKYLDQAVTTLPPRFSRAI